MVAGENSANASGCGILGGLSRSVLFLLIFASCYRWEFFDDGSSVSWGKASRGVLVSPARLPTKGRGFYIPKRWKDRGLRYGTEELVSTIKHVGKKLNRKHRGRKMGVADLSLKRGGRSAWHRSHQTGRDVDIVFMMRDDQGLPYNSEFMLRFNDDGLATNGSGIRFDTSANWTIVRELLLNPNGDIQYIFISEGLKQKLLDHAQRIGEPPGLIEAASYVVRQPSDSLAHNDHFHVRMLCSTYDLSVGCKEYGTLRWYKRDLKYRNRGKKLRTE